MTKQQRKGGRSKAGSPTPPVDPHAAREADRYENPVASRELILELLSNADHPLTHEQICQRLQADTEEDMEALRRRLRAMERDGQLLVNRRGAYGPVDKLDLIHGRVIGHRDGYGFLSPLDGSDDLYLSARQMAQVFDGDEALASIAGVDNRGRREGKLVEILKRGTTEVVGRYYEESGIGAVIPDNARINHDVLIPPNAKNKAQHGQIVVAEITHYPTRQLGAKGRITEVLGEHLDPGLEIDVAIRAHNIPHTWPDAVLREAASLDDAPSEADKQGRVDLRKLAFVTIDGEDARDFDDAVYCEKKLRGGWRLWVAIADVSHYVRPGSALDDEAQVRGNSVYFPERVVPMLPEVLSNGLCSLMPEVDRLAMVCEMNISRAGRITGYQFYEGVIHSHARLTYTQVGEVLAQGSHPEVDKRIVPHIKRLHGLYKALREARDARGAIDFETTETRILFNEQCKIDAIVPVTRNDAHKLIEECMLCANVATARFFEEHKLPILYRVHEGPGEEKLENLRGFLGELGLELRGGDKPSPMDYQTLRQQIGERPDKHIIETMLLRSLSQAVYQPENKGHFGLHYPAYAHFTSPIRRYPDLLVHRGIRRVIRSDMPSKKVKRMKAPPIPVERIFPYDLPAMLAFGEQCSMSERRADDATRDVDAWLKCEFLQERVGETFQGVVAAVTSFGLFVELSDLYIEGLVHISALPGDYYHFDRAKQRLVGERSGRSYKLGDTVSVQVARVDLDDKKIDLELLDAGGNTQRKSAGRSAGKSKRNSGGGKGRKNTGKSDAGAKRTTSARKPSANKGSSASKGKGSGKGDAKKGSGRAGVRKRR
ncbi:MAG: ribonuclease R [Halieaceae bacterium]|nr:ribonuclease R [Halieaceae bacterium]